MKNIGFYSTIKLIKVIHKMKISLFNVLLININLII
jgi:hypothetical protein